MELNKEIESLVEENKLPEACVKLDSYITSDSALDEFIFAEKIYKQISERIGTSGKTKFTKLKVAVLRSITIELILPFISIKCYRNRINPEFYLGGYNIIDQEILNKNSGLYNFNPDVIVIFIRLEEICPKLVDSYLELSSEEVETETENILNKVDGLLSTFRTKSKAKIILHNFELPEFPAFGIVDSQNEKSQRRAFEKINLGLIEIVKKYGETYLLDYERLISVYGKMNWFDEKKWYIAKAPLSGVGLKALADEYIKYFKAMLGMTKKCLVLDLDNTLWGGVLGEEGIEGIKLGHNPQGNAFLDFQKEILKLYHKGFILAINSKNNEENVMEVFDRHPNIILKKEYFTSMKINWVDKVQNMKEIAGDLNIGMDSFVFFDDNPVERELIKQQLPEIHTIDIPDDPYFYARMLRELPDFERLSFTEEDKKRGEMYQMQIKRKKLERSCTSLEDFYKSLEMKAIIKLDNKLLIPRLASMTQKTNQFNLTTKRYSENDISSFIGLDNHRVYSLQLIDKFGDNGVVGEMIIKEKGEIWEIDSFLLSCRVIGRTVETAFLSYLISEGKKVNVKYIVGRYIPTEKNVVVKDLYKNYGFDLLEVLGEKGTVWSINIKEKTIESPEWIKIIKNYED